MLKLLFITTNNKRELSLNGSNTVTIHTAFKQPRSCKKQFRGSVKSIKSSSQKYFNDINQKIFGWETFEQTQLEHFWLSCIPKSPHIQRSQIVFEFCAQVSKYKFLRMSSGRLFTIILQQIIYSRQQTIEINDGRQQTVEFYFYF